MSDSRVESIQQFLRQISYVPVQNSETAGWQDIFLHKHSLPPGEIHMPGIVEHSLIVTLAPKIQFDN